VYYVYVRGREEETERESGGAREREGERGGREKLLENERGKGGGRQTDRERGIVLYISPF
jgi:hypothetical protein